LGIRPKPGKIPILTSAGAAAVDTGMNVVVAAMVVVEVR
jgi:hypothetical protein